MKVKKSAQEASQRYKIENKLPLQHVAIIMDGNRRWADSRKLPRLLGHREGVKSLKRLVKHVGNLGLPYLTVYAFSSENWQRSPEEVDYLFDLFGLVIKEELRELHESNVRLSFIGHLERMPINLKESFESAMDCTRKNTGLGLQIAINYGSRLEITEAIKKISSDIANGAIIIDEVNENLVEKYLYTNGLPDPELIIRTGGQMRLSNYMLWQIAYAEFYMSTLMWPDFTPDAFDRAIEEFKQRERRFGGD